MNTGSHSAISARSNMTKEIGTLKREASTAMLVLPRTCGMSGTRNVYLVQKEHPVEMIPMTEVLSFETSSWNPGTIAMILKLTWFLTVRSTVE